jgi:hypothetical protein
MDDDNHDELSDRQRIWRALIVTTTAGLAVVLPLCCIAAAGIGFLLAFLNTMDQMD